MIVYKSPQVPQVCTVIKAADHGMALVDTMGQVGLVSTNALYDTVDDVRLAMMRDIEILTNILNER